MTVPRADVPATSPNARDAEDSLDFEPVRALAGILRPSTPEAIAVHDLATEVAQRHLTYGRRGLVLCGASYGSGVTVTAACLAVALAGSGISTILVEANLRRPSLDALILPSRPISGLVQYLRGEAARIGVINSDVLANLAVVFAGGVASDADELLASDRFRELLDHAMRNYECMIVDTPPANRYAEARTIAAAVGYAAIVGRRKFSFLNDAELLARELDVAGVKVVGSIFNRG